jgi:hypothetical protein
MNQENPENKPRNDQDTMLEKVSENWGELGLFHKVGFTAITTIVAEEEKIKKKIKNKILGRS